MQNVRPTCICSGVLLCLVALTVPVAAQGVDSVPPPGRAILYAAIGAGTGPGTTYSLRARLHVPYVGIGVGYARRNVAEPPTYQPQRYCDGESWGTSVDYTRDSTYELAGRLNVDLHAYLDVHADVAVLMSFGLVFSQSVYVVPGRRRPTIGCEQDRDTEFSVGGGVEWYPTKHIGFALEYHSHLGAIAEVAFRL